MYRHFKTTYRSYLPGTDRMPETLVPNNQSVRRNIQEERRPHINIFLLVSIMICCITTLTKSKLPAFKDATITEEPG
jgi:hypothetical protein